MTLGLEIAIKSQHIRGKHRFKFIFLNLINDKNEKCKKKEQKVGMLLQKRKDTRGVGISNSYEEIYISSYNHTQ